MKKLLLLFTICLLATAVKAQDVVIEKDSANKIGIAKVYVKQGKDIFTHCLPVSEYQVLFTVKMPAIIWSNRQINSIGKIEDMVQKHANKQGLKMGVIYDALIVNGWKNSYAIRYK